MWVKYIKSDKQFEKGSVIHIDDNETVISRYDDGVLVPLVGPDGPSIHEAPPEDVEALRDNLVRSKEKGASEFKKLKINFTRGKPVLKRTAKKTISKK